MTDLDQRHIAEWISDAFAILCVRVGSSSESERRVRLGFEALLRHLGSSPLHAVASVPPPPSRGLTASTTDLRSIVKALDSCLAVFDRYDAALTASQRRIQTLVRTTRRFADAELAARRQRLNAAAVTAPAPLAAVAVA